MDGYCCNLCQVHVQGIVYRTHCMHLYCPACAQSTFRTRKCALCQSSLTMDTVYEVAAGAEGVDVREQMFQCLMSYGIGESHLAMDRFYHSLREISTFINVQNRIKLLQYRDLESAYQSKILEKDELLTQLKTQLVDDNDQLRHTVLNLGDQLNKKSAEVSQLEENLKDKIRKCQAWEKAYTNIRSQLINKDPLKSTYLDHIPSDSRNVLDVEQDNAPRRQSFVSVQTYRTIPRAQIPEIGLRDPFSSGAESNNNSIMKLLGQKRSITDAPQSAATSSDRRLELRKYMATGSGSDSAMIRHVNNIPPDLVIQQSNHVGNAHVSASSSAFFDRR